MKSLIVVGYGNMAEAILAHNSFLAKTYDIFIAGRNLQKINSFISAHNLKAQSLETKCSDEKYVIECDGKNILLCIKPHAIENFIFKGKAKCVYSVLAGVNVDKLREHIDVICVIRAMPNIAARSKLSATAFYTHSMMPEDEFKLLLQNEIYPFIESFGIALKVQQEKLIESSIATSGSGIAFLALVAESLVDAGILEGLTYTQSIALVRQCFIGFAKELGHKTPSELKYTISSPGGTTIRGLNALEQSGVRGAIINAAHIAAQYAKDCITHKTK